MAESQGVFDYDTAKVGDRSTSLAQRANLSLVLPLKDVQSRESLWHSLPAWRKTAVIALSIATLGMVTVTVIDSFDVQSQLNNRNENLPSGFVVDENGEMRPIEEILPQHQLSPRPAELPDATSTSTTLPK